MIIETTVLELGKEGDGIIEVNNKIYHVAYVLPNEKIKVEINDNNAKLIEIITKSQKRIEAICPYYTKCGGCKLQHLDNESYKNFKSSLIDSYDDITFIPAGNRRRASFTGDGKVIGFNAEKSNQVIAIKNCLLLNEGLNKCLNDLQCLAPNIGKASILATETNNGIDITITAKNISTSAEMIKQLSNFAASHNITRITINEETLVTLEKPMITLNDKEVNFPAGSFLQPSKESESILINKVCEAFPKKTKIVDLFCGSGTFAYGLWSYGHKVTGFDILTTHPFTRRDLEQNPLVTKELNEYKGIVFDPPRAGAMRLATNIAKSKVPTVVAVSCNPKTFKRDRKILETGGYKLEKISIVDQFIYSPHLEIVAVFKK